MRYYESRDQTAELLRMVLPLMSRHQAGFHPLSYAVWYEYAAGTNLALKHAVDQLLGEGRQLTDDDVARLFDAHVAVRDIDSSMRIRSRIQEVVERVNDVTAAAASDVGQYSEQLDQCGSRLRPDLDSVALGQVLAVLRADTSRIQERTDDYRQRLEESSSQVQTLRQDLEEARGLAMLDPLSGLLNQRGFERKRRQQDAAGLERSALLLIDIDDFQGINDTHGHLIGDKVLAAMAQIVKSCLGDRAQPARLGGEQFAALLPDTALADAVELAERIRSTAERGRIRKHDRDETIAAVTVSIGLAGYSSGEGWDGLQQRAARALARAKQDGRNRVTVAN